MAVPEDVSDGAPPTSCGLCGRPMAADQEWCLECGAARTVIARPPDWRIPVLVIGIVVLLIAGAFAYAMVQLGRHAGRVTVVNTSAPRQARHTAPKLASWPPGLDGYTVVLASDSTRAAADTAARKLLGHIRDVGVLATDQHPQMHPAGAWEVYAGRYPSWADAQAAATRADHQGQPQAKPALVQRPGGG